MDDMRLPLWIFAIGASLLASSIVFRHDGTVQTAVEYLRMYLGFVGKFAMEIALAIMSSFLVCKQMPAIRRFVALTSLVIVGICSTLTDWSLTSFVHTIGSNPLSILSLTQVVSALTLVSIAALVTSAREGLRGQFGIVHAFSVITLASFWCLGLRAQGTYALVAFSSMVLVGIIGALIWSMATSDSSGMLIIANGGLMIAAAGIFHANGLGLLDWFGFVPKLARYTDSGILPFTLAVSLAAGMALMFRSKTNQTDDTPNHAMHTKAASLIQ
jgi:hypothetical protein